MSTSSARSFVNQGVVASRSDMLHLVRPELKRPIGPNGAAISPFARRRLEFDTSDFVPMELLGLDAHENE